MQTKANKDHREWIRREALTLGYDLVGFTGLELTQEDRLNLEKFAKETKKGGMAWFMRRLLLRQVPKKLYPEAKSALVLGLYYRDLCGEEALKKAKVQIARYAHGRDYHRVLGKKAKRLLGILKKKIPELKARICVDSAPVPEKILGRMAGLGWQGKNTNLIHPKLGSYFFLSVLLLNLDFLRSKEGQGISDSSSDPIPDPIPDLIPDHCRDCSLCIEACPTQALSSRPPYRIDAHKCLSYLSIEHKGSVRPELQNSFAGQAFGCDICQEVCPYNRNRQARQRSTQESAFTLDARIDELIQSGELKAETDWQEWSKGSPLRRVSLEKMRNNLELARNSSRH